MRFVRRHLSFANVVSVLALFVALGGVSYAAFVPKNSVGTRQLKSGAVTSPKVADGSLRARDFQAGTLLTGPRGPEGPRGLPGPSTGPAGGDLSGSYPNPSIGAGKVTPANIATVPAAALTNSVSQSIATGTPTAVSFDGESFDTAGLHSEGQPARLTAPIAGLYQVNVMVIFDLNNTTGSRGLELMVNGATVEPIGSTRVPAATTGNISEVSTSGLVSLAAGDFVEAVVIQSSGGALNVLGQKANASPRFSMCWVGPAS